MKRERLFLYWRAAVIAWETKRPRFVLIAFSDVKKNTRVKWVPCFSNEDETGSFRLPGNHGCTLTFSF